MPSGIKKQDEIVVAPGGPRDRSTITEVRPGMAVDSANGDSRIVAAPSTTLVVTPGGYRASNLVHTIEPGHGLDYSEGRMRKLALATRSAVADFGVIPPRATSRPLMPENSFVPADRKPAFGTGWITYASWTNNTGRHLNLFRTKWVVPPAPATQSGQTIFLFNGIQNSTMIYQPVLQWGPSADGGGNFWAVASWYVDGQGGPAFKTPLVKVNSGDVLSGLMTLTGQTGSQFSYSCQFEGIANSTLPIQNVEELTWCIETLEAYGITKCSDYPATLKTLFTGIEIQAGNKEAAITWSPSNSVTDCGQHAVVISNASPNGEVDLYYKSINVPAAVSEPSAYALVNNQTGVIEQHNLFRSANGHIQALWFNFAQGWHYEDRSTIVAGVPAAVAGPFGYAFMDSATGLVEQHNLFRTADGHVHALWFNFQTGWHHEDRSTLVAGVPAATGNLFGYTFINDPTGIVEQHNLFRSADGHIHALWFNFQTGWHHEDRSALVAGTPAAVTDPVAYTFVNSPTGVVEQHHLFRTADGHIHALWFNFQTGWHHEDRTALIAGTPAAVGNPFGYSLVNNATGVVEQHNLFRTADGHIHALWFNFQTGWHHEDRTALIAGTPAAVGDPFGYAFVNSATGLVEQHNLFRTADGHIHALWFNFQTGWHQEDRTALVAGTPAAVGDPFGYAFINSATGLVEQHNLFRTADGHIHALWFNFQTGWHQEDRSVF